jgi:hypothetical protein
MMFRPATLRGIAAGNVTVAFRRWSAPRVRAGGRQRTPLGVVIFRSVEPVDPRSLTDGDARDAGLASLDELHALLDRREGTAYRIGLAMHGPDPRVALREAVPEPTELRAIRSRLERLDRASRHGPWTQAVLRAIADAPETRAADLAAAFGRERDAFKLDVRKLKELGLTESLRPGYRLSRRGWAVLAELERVGSAPSR